MSYELEFNGTKIIGVPFTDKISQEIQWAKGYMDGLRAGRIQGIEWMKHELSKNDRDKEKYIGFDDGLKKALGILIAMNE